MAQNDDGNASSAISLGVGASTFDYNTADLNKLSDAELRAHKQVMDRDYYKNFVGKDDAGFKYDTRKDFKAMREQALANGAAGSEDDWD